MEDVSLEWSKAELSVSEQSCLVREGPYPKAALFQATLHQSHLLQLYCSTIVLLQN